jgi:hypothetical protein
MKPHHAAALALVGWYLVAPPALPYDPDKVDESAPLSRWDVLTKVDSESQCEAEKARLTGTPLGRVAKCIVGDDPRLKK